MDKLIMIKYGELTTKKGNRGFFVKTLYNNIKNKLSGEDVLIKYDRCRMYITCNDEENVINKLKEVFGIHAMVVCYKTPKDEEIIKNKVYDILKDSNKLTFKIETKRIDKKYPVHSMEFNKIVGSYILKNTDMKVDVHNPDIRVCIEIREDACYIYGNEIKGSGGYPVGIQGKGLLMLSGGIDSPVAGYLALKRGIDIDCLYFESPPHTSIEAKNKVKTLSEIINKYSGNIKLHVVPFTKLQEEIYKNVNDEYVITIMRRMMYRISEAYAKKIGAKAIINGESIGQVASQTLSSMQVINDVTNFPIIRPVACFDKLEIIDISNKIGTYETSILPYEDCCTIFLPKHPVINPVLSKCIYYEERFDYSKIISEIIDNIEVIDLKKNNKYDELL